MCKSTCSGESNTLAQYTANTGIAQLSLANSSLTGAGSTLVLAAAASGTLVKSVTIKATEPVSLGMIRLFIRFGVQYSLYKEVPVPVAPALSNTPTPTPVLQTFEIKLDGGLKLEQGYSLYASTQTGNSFNVVAEALDWSFPDPLPEGTCCNYYQENAASGVVTVSEANPNLDGTGTIGNLFQAPIAPMRGAKVKSITIKALQSTNEGMIRIFVGDAPANYRLLKEIYIPATTQSGFEPSFKQVVEMDYALEVAHVIGVSTQNAEAFAVTVEAVNWYYGI